MAKRRRPRRERPRSNQPAVRRDDRRRRRAAFSPFRGRIGDLNINISASFITQYVLFPVITPILTFLLSVAVSRFSGRTYRLPVLTVLALAILAAFPFLIIPIRHSQSPWPRLVPQILWRPISILPIAIGPTIVIVVLAFLGSAPLTYYLIDQTDGMRSVVPDLRGTISATLSDQISATNLAMRIYGSTPPTDNTCSATRQIIPSTDYTSFNRKLPAVLSQVEPRGHAALAPALLAALSDLSRVSGHKRLVVITSGPNPQCDEPRFTSLATVIRQLRPSVDFIIVSVGPISSTAQESVARLAVELGARYEHVENASQLEPVIRPPTYYFPVLPGR